MIGLLRQNLPPGLHSQLVTLGSPVLPPTPILTPLPPSAPRIRPRLFVLLAGALRYPLWFGFHLDRIHDCQA